MSRVKRFDRVGTREGGLRRNEHFVLVDHQHGAVADRALREDVAVRDYVARRGCRILTRDEVGPDGEPLEAVGDELHLKREGLSAAPLKLNDDAALVALRQKERALGIEGRAVPQNGGRAAAPREAVAAAEREVFLNGIAAVDSNVVLDEELRADVVVEVEDAGALEGVDRWHRHQHGFGLFVFLRRFGSGHGRRYRRGGAAREQKRGSGKRSAQSRRNERAAGERKRHQ